MAANTIPLYIENPKGNDPKLIVRTCHECEGPHHDGETVAQVFYGQEFVTFHDRCQGSMPIEFKSHNFTVMKEAQVVT